MITLTLIAAAIIIVIGAFMIHRAGFEDGYSVGHDKGFAHAKGQHLPPMERHEETFQEEVDRLLREMAQERESANLKGDTQ